MLFRTSCGHVTRHRNSRVRREADAACKPLRRGYKVVTAICCKSSKNFTNTPKKRRFFLFLTSMAALPGKRSGCRSDARTGVGDAGTGIEEWQSCRREDGAGSCGSQAGRRRSQAGRRRSRAERDHAGTERCDAKAERGDTEPNRALRGPDGACAGRGRCGGALRRRGQGGGVSGRKGCFRRKMK